MRTPAYIQSAALALLAISFSACNDSNSEVQYVPLSDVLPKTGAVAPASGLSAPGESGTAMGATAKLNPAHGQPGHRCDLAVGAPLPIDNPAPAATPVSTVQPVTVAATQPQPASTAGLNPAHGQPGHRCDIAVGAPLDSKPATQAQPVAVSTSNTNTKVAPGTNPPHGQPGHRCDIAVGAPLNPPAADKKLEEIKSAVAENDSVGNS